jgi:hypothetical protein
MNRLANFKGKSRNQVKPRPALTATVRRQVDSTVDHVMQSNDSVTSSASRSAWHEDDIVASVSEIQVTPEGNDNVSWLNKSVYIGLNENLNVNKCVALSPLKCVHVKPNDGQNESPAVVSVLYDTGRGIAVAHPHVLEGLNVYKCGTVNIRSAIGDCIQCDLCHLNICAVENDAYLNILCAIADKANKVLILTADIIDRLLSDQ